MPADAIKVFTQLAPISTMLTSGSGTFTKLLNTGVPYISRTTGSGTCRILIPVPAPRVQSEFGVVISKVELPVRAAIANMTSAPILTLYKRNLLAVAAGGVNMTASSITGTLVDTATFLATDRLYTFTPTLSTFIDGDNDLSTNASYNLDCYFNLATTTQLRVYDAIITYQTLT